MAPFDPAEAHQAELADLLDGCATRSLAIWSERVRLVERQQQLLAEAAELEAAVARARVAAARHRPIDSELDALRRLQLHGNRPHRRAATPAPAGDRLGEGRGGFLTSVAAP